MCKKYSEFTVSLEILSWSKSMMLLFGYFQQGIYKIEFLSGGGGGGGAGGAGYCAAVWVFHFLSLKLHNFLRF